MTRTVPLTDVYAYVLLLLLVCLEHELNHISLSLYCIRFRGPLSSERRERSAPEGDRARAMRKCRSRNACSSPDFEYRSFKAIALAIADCWLPSIDATIVHSSSLHTQQRNHGIATPPVSTIKTIHHMHWQHSSSFSSTWRAPSLRIAGAAACTATCITWDIRSYPQLIRTHRCEKRVRTRVLAPEKQSPVVPSASYLGRI